ncbi:phosphorylcholine phosphatase [Pseudoxanthomonas suwonensis]|uniref:phosphoserine phosphatase n=1 Tax=Pseudoxanthomonas suwonensis TaxID=314722 RepID=A0A0E3YZU8_9GAMM|nr:phosphorylcholine phosphatase [Pseudoxanthomonas suwonensis]AKC85794.1 phosphorylcholine phosphatase [Pseudoxanthomonas suwonensis]
MMRFRDIAAVGILLGCYAMAEATELKHWPAPAAEALDRIIAANADSGAYAVFDMDNTSYRHDLEEALIPFLEMKGVLTRETMDPSLKLLPFKDVDGNKESLTNYAARLCAIDEKVCMPWAAQIVSGFSLKELKGHVDELMAREEPIKTTYYGENDVVETIEIPPPRIFAGMTELYSRLMEHGIEVYVVTAAHEELVRMIVSDPKYGYNVKPENVIGVSTLLENPATGELTTARKMIAEGTYDWKATMDYIVRPYLWTPGTWMEGKQAAILAYIDQWRPAALVAGDSPDSDGYMLLHGADTAKGGRIWVGRSEKSRKLLDEKWIAGNARQQQALGQPVTADKGWIFVTPEEIQ